MGVPVRMSSVMGHGSCTVARIENTEANYAATFRLPEHYLGRSLNDDVGYIHVYYG